ncbi:MAG: choice-of-anchor Q domain-containing protein, partial [Planctomycetota bacterium]
GGIINDNGTANQLAKVSILFDEVTLAYNTAQSRGGGFYTDGGTYYANAELDITITNSTITGNTAVTSTGGGIDNRLYAYTGATGSTVSMTVRNTAVVGNAAGSNGGGIAHATSNDVISAGVTTTIENATISGNSADGYGGGIFSSSSGALIVGSSTVTANTSDATGSGYFASGGGIHIAAGAAALQNTIVAGNTDNSGVAPDLNDLAQAVSASFTLIGDNTGSSLSPASVGMPDLNGNLIGDSINGVIDPLLGTLQNNGGLTLTHALLAGSPARDAGHAFGILADQRGGARGMAADMGAFEGLHVIVDDTGDGNDGDPTNATTTLREAIAVTNVAETFDIITFDLGNSATILRPAGGTELLVTNSLVIDGPGIDALTIDANGTVTGTRVMRMEDSVAGASSELVLRGLTLSGGAVVGQNGGGLLTQENLTLQGVRITGNTAMDDVSANGGYGGGIQMNANAVGIGSTAWLKIENSTISGNTGFNSGGGIQATNSATALGSHSIVSIGNATTFSDNRSFSSGGGVDLDNDSDAPFAVSQVTIIDTMFQNNIAFFDGGGMNIDSDQEGYRSTAMLTMAASQFSGNIAEIADGGALRIDHDLRAVRAASRVAIRDTSFTNNSATVDEGGAVMDETDVINYKAHALFVLDGVQVSNNAADEGGGLFSDLDVRGNAGRAVVQIKDSQFSQNMADDEGGGIHTSIDSRARGSEALSIVMNSTIADNTADEGGGFYSTNRTSYFYPDATNKTVIVATTISGNTATNLGGGIYQDDSSAMLIAKTTISGNAAISGAGGGIFVNNNSGSVSVENSTITANSAATTGGGLALADGRGATVDNTIIAGNMAAVSDPDLATGTGADAVLSFSLIGNVGNATVVDNGNNQTGTSGTPIDPLLGPLQDNGGPTFTHALLIGGPAIDMGDALGTTMDQRGFLRTVGTQTDVGAYENQPVNCDFDDDGDCDINDIDALITEIASAANGLLFDLTGDGMVNLADRDQWLADAGARHLASMSPYLLGDANLDGVVDGLDFIAWNNSKFTATGTWSQADWNADGTTDGLDFILWNNNKFQNSDAAPLIDRVFATLADDDDDDDPQVELIHRLALDADQANAST